MKNHIIGCIMIILIIATFGCVDKNPNPGNSIYDLKIDPTQDNQVVRYITLKDVDEIVIEYDITPIINPCNLQFATYNVVAQTGESLANYESNIIDVKKISTSTASASASGSVILNAKGAKSIGIGINNGKGRVKLIMNESRSFNPFNIFIN